MKNVVVTRSSLGLLAIVAGASWASAQSPVITKVSKITTQQYQIIVITGSGFGTHAAYTGDTPYISLLDQSTTPPWQAGYSPYNDTVTLIVHKWEDSKIVLGGFSGAWGQYNYKLTKGDSEQIEIWNPQTGAGPAATTTTIVGEPTATSLTSSPNPSSAGQPVTFTAQVSSKAGPPADGETVSFVNGKTALGKGSLSGGSATFTTSTLPVGTTSVTAVYRGDSEFSASKSKPVDQVVQ